MERTQEQKALIAITAVLNGVWDNPEFMAVNVLYTRDAEIIAAIMAHYVPHYESMVR